MRDLDLNDLRVFVRVVDRGGFAAAARELGVPTSTVSRTIARLEQGTGTRLLHRTPRSVHATSEGQAIYASVSEAVGTLERAARELEPATRKPKGVLRVTAPTDIGSVFLADVAVAFTERYPQVQVDLSLTNRAVSLIDEGFDVAVRAALRLTDSTLVAKKVGDVEHAVYTSPRYLERHGAPATPGELAAHRCIVFRGKNLVKTWRLERAHGPSGTQGTQGTKATVDVEVRGIMGGDDFGYVRAATIAGGGVALLPRLVCAKDEAAGRLVRVLPAYSAQGAGLYVLYPSATHVPARVTAFRDFVVGAFEKSGADGPPLEPLEPQAIASRLSSPRGPHTDRSPRRSRRSLLAAHPQHPEANYTLGLVLLPRDPGGALACFERGEASAPTDADYPRSRARALLGLGRRAEARTAIDRAASLAPGDPRVAQLSAEIGRSSWASASSSIRWCAAPCLPHPRSRPRS